MGKLRSLTQDEILIQLYWANKICRIFHGLYEINNVVFMGMYFLKKKKNTFTVYIFLIADCFV